MRPYYDQQGIKIFHGDCLGVLKQLPSESVQCCVTSPPYWGLRDYGTADWNGGDPDCDHAVGRFTTTVSDKQASNHGSGTQQAIRDCPKCGATRVDKQLGLEKTPEEYCANMVAVFREVKRVLRNDGTLWLNLGDSYSGSGKGRNPDGFAHHAGFEAHRKQSTNKGTLIGNVEGGIVPDGTKPKDLVGIPWMMAFALRADGWYLRADIIWHKPNPMPESVTDRPTKSHEYIFLLAKSARYFYDAEAIKEEAVYSGMPERRLYDGKWGAENEQQAFKIMNGFRNKRDVWTVNSFPFPEAHFATFPPDLIKPCILAGTSQKGCCTACGSPLERILEVLPMEINRSNRRNEMGLDYASGTPSSGTMTKPRESSTIGWQPTCKCIADTKPCIVLDPFHGAGTTAMVAQENFCHYVGIELNSEYIDISTKRLRQSVLAFT
jgi:DNA modification methylase